MMANRPDWDSYFMEIADIVSKRSTCLRRSVGALIVKDKRILATGYNGAPTGLQHCMEVGCLREKMKVAPGERHELCRGLHAEQNAIIQAAFHGVSINGAHLYCTHLPCSICIKMLINAGIEKVHYLEGYPDDLASTADVRASVLARIPVENPQGGWVLRLRTTSGGYRWMAAKVTVLDASHGTSVAMVVGLTIVDELVSARRRAEQDEERLSATLDSLLDPHIVLEAVRDDVENRGTEDRHQNFALKRTPKVRGGASSVIGPTEPTPVGTPGLPS